jgi:hypothetical protein
MPRFQGDVGSDGALRLDAPGAWRVALAALRGRRVELTLEAERTTRTNQQLRRWFGCIVPVVRDVLNAQRDPLLLPLSKEQTHRLLVGAFVGHEETPLGLVPIESRTLTPAQFAIVQDKVEAHYRSEGITFPQLDEVVEVAS